MRNNKIKMTVTMDVTIPQALALKSMFDYWNSLASMGSSREVAFYVDGDGNFRPNCLIETSAPIPEITPIIRKKAVASDNGHGDLMFDFDNIARYINHPEMYDVDGNVITRES